MSELARICFYLVFVVFTQLGRSEASCTTTTCVCAVGENESCPIWMMNGNFYSEFVDMSSWTTDDKVCVGATNGINVVSIAGVVVDNEFTSFNNMTSCPTSPYEIDEYDDDATSLTCGETFCACGVGDGECPEWILDSNNYVFVTTSDGQTFCGGATASAYSSTNTITLNGQQFSIDDLDECPGNLYNWTVIDDTDAPSAAPTASCCRIKQRMKRIWLGLRGR